MIKNIENSTIIQIVWIKMVIDKSKKSNNQYWKKGGHDYLSD